MTKSTKLKKAAQGLNFQNIENVVISQEVEQRRLAGAQVF